MLQKRELVLISVWLAAIVFLGSTGFFALPVTAEGKPVDVGGRVYEFGEKDPYDYASAASSDHASKKNTYGTFRISGDLASADRNHDFLSFRVNGGSVALQYTYSDELRDAPEDSWHLVEDKSREVAGLALSESVMKGVVVVQTSKDGEIWTLDAALTDYFAQTQKTSSFYTTKGVQLANGCFYRVIIAYETAMRVGEDQILFVKTNQYDYKKHAEVYEFYLCDAVQSSIGDDDNTSRNLGRPYRADKDNNGYAGENEFDIKDPHYGWELGQFFVSGYTRETKDDNDNPVFLKNAGDQITLWFKLKQDIDKLNNDGTLSIADDKKGYDTYFQTAKTDMGRGALIIRYTDEKGVKDDTPEIYTNFLEANATTSADTVVKLFEEGDYEVALDYKIKSTPRVVAGIEIIPEYSDYRIFFRFSVRNGNCMVFPFDVTTGDELTDEAITPNGFRLDMAKSRYLTIDVQKSIVTVGANGYVEDVRFNRPAKDGDEYTEEGIYTFTVSNRYTGESTTKRIYVGDADYMRALSVNRMTVAELNAQVAAGASIKDSGVLLLPDGETLSTVPPAVPDAANSGEAGSGGVTAFVKSAAPFIAVIAAAAFIAAVGGVLGRKKRRRQEQETEGEG